MTNLENALQPGDALLIVDVQKDFCPGGALAIDGGDEVVPALNRCIGAVCNKGCPVYASRDWHPARHISFRERGGPWPSHCLQDSDGARFHPELTLPEDVVKITKGVRFDQDQNSAFDQTGLAQQLRADGISRLWIGGLAEEVCVRATVLDALESGFEVILISNATRPVTGEGGRQAEVEADAAGAQLEVVG